MYDFLNLGATGIPLWVFLVTCFCAVLMGIGLRRWIDHRKRREEIRHQEKVKAIKAEQKHLKRKMKKGKNKKKAGAPKPPAGAEE